MARPLWRRPLGAEAGALALAALSLLLATTPPAARALELGGRTQFVRAPWKVEVDWLFWTGSIVNL